MAKTENSWIIYHFTNIAGFPATMVLIKTSLVITATTPSTALSPIRTSLGIIALAPVKHFFQITTILDTDREPVPQFPSGNRG
jgi:hypothetical protein